MFPERVTLDQGQQAALDEVSGDLHRMGFGLEYESGSDWRITAVPAMLRKSDPKDVILRILDSVQEDSVNYGKDGAGDFSIQQRVALMMARSASIRRGVRLSADEMGAYHQQPVQSSRPQSYPRRQPHLPDPRRKADLIYAHHIAVHILEKIDFNPDSRCKWYVLQHIYCFCSFNIWSIRILAVLLHNLKTILYIP